MVGIYQLENTQEFVFLYLLNQRISLVLESNRGTTNILDQCQFLHKYAPTPPLN